MLLLLVLLHVAVSSYKVLLLLVLLCGMFFQPCLNTTAFHCGCITGHIPAIRSNPPKKNQKKVINNADTFAHTARSLHCYLLFFSLIGRFMIDGDVNMADALKESGLVSRSGIAKRRMPTPLLEREQLDLTLALSMGEQEAYAVHAPAAPVARKKSKGGDASLKTLRDRQEAAKKDVRSPWFVGNINKDSVEVCVPPPP